MALLSKETLAQIRARNQERKSSYGQGDKRPKIEKGEQILTISNIELTNSKNKDPMIVLEFTQNNEYQPMKEYYLLKQDNPGIERLVDFLQSAFKYDIGVCETAEDIVKAILPFKGKLFKGAIRIKEKLFEYIDQKTGEKMLMVSKNPSLWFAGNINNVDFKVKLESCVVPLSTEDKKRYLEFKAQQNNNSQSNSNQPAQQPESKDAPNEGQDGLPF